MKTLLKTLFLIILASTTLRGATGYYDTYAAWGDRSEAKHGHLYLYTGASASTDYFLYTTGVANTTINNMVQSQVGLGAYQPATEYPNAGGAIGFGKSYFKLSSTNTMTWEVDETTDCHCGDAHGFVAAADNNNSYRGAIFMTFLRHDSDPDTNSGGLNLADFGDDSAVLNVDSVPINVTVRKWTGAAWGGVLAASPSIPVGGVWMWSPDESAAKTSGGTLLANEGHYRYDISGGQGMLYKGNLYTTYYKPNWNRDNAWLNAPDVTTGKKIGTDLIGAIIKDGAAPSIIVTNLGASTATFDLKIFSPVAGGTAWPVNGNNPAGSWTTIYSHPGLAPGASYSYTDSSYDTFARVVATNGQPLESSMGVALTQSRYDGGDYYYAKDTTQAIGKLFNWGGSIQNTGSDGPLEVHVVAPSGGTTVTLNATGSSTGAMATQVQTSTGPDCGLLFNVDSTTKQDVQFNLTADQYVYVWAMSNTGLPADVFASRFGETFFSNPPTPQNLIVATKSVNVSTATLGDTITYVLTGHNIGSSTMVTAALWDTLPSGISFVTSTPPATYAVPPLYGWDISPLAPLMAASVTITAVINTGFNGEVKHNYALAGAFSAPNNLSSDAPVRILIPGADLQKSANVTTAQPGDSVTYSITYFNSAAALPATPHFNLRVKGMLFDASSMTYNFEITNLSGAAVNVNDLQICYWFQDSMTPAQINFYDDYGGNTNPWAGWGGGTWLGTASVVSPAIVRPDSRNANLEVCWHYTSGNSLPNGSFLDGIALRLAVNYPVVWNNVNTSSVNFSRRPAPDVYTDDNHFALYYQGSLVQEYTGAATPDANTACEPQNWVQVNDTVPAEVNYVGSSPAATLVGGAPQLTWFDPCVPPQQNFVVSWWGTVKAGTAGGTVINNRADCQANSIAAISNLVTITVPIVGTLTNTPTPSPSFTASPSASYSATRSPTPSASPTMSPTRTASPAGTATPTFTATGSFTPVPPAPTLTPTALPLQLHLYPNSPNPFGPSGTYLAYNLNVDATVDIRVYDISGELVRQLDPFPGKRGNNEEFWDAQNSVGKPVASGTYIYKVKATSAAGDVESDLAKCSAIK